MTQTTPPPVDAARAKHISEAYERVAQANHYMVGIVDADVTDDELDAAKQLLISKQNATDECAPESAPEFATLDGALDLVEAEQTRRLAEARRQMAVPRDASFVVSYRTVDSFGVGHRYFESLASAKRWLLSHDAETEFASGLVDLRIAPTRRPL